MGAGVLTLGLAACGDTAELVDGSEGDKAAESDLTLEEVFTKSSEASEDITSLHADMKTNQLMDMGMEGMEMEIVMDLAMDMTMEPLAFYQVAKTTMVSDEAENMPPMEMEMYLAEEGMFMFEPTMESWLKMPDADVAELESLANQQVTDPAEQLEQLEAFQDDFAFEQNADEYILTLDAAGEEFQELIDQQLETTLGQMEMEVAAPDMSVNSVSYEIFIDKETFLPNAMNVVMDIDMEAEGESVSIKSDVQSKFSKYNEIEPITVPAEVVEQATAF